MHGVRGVMRAPFPGVIQQSLELGISADNLRPSDPRYGEAANYELYVAPYAPKLERHRVSRVACRVSHVASALKETLASLQLPELHAARAACNEMALPHRRSFRAWQAESGVLELNGRQVKTSD